jgi:hypothetical protein
VKIILLALIITFATGCSTTKDKGNENEFTSLKSEFPNLELFARLIDGSNGWEFTSMCYQVRLPSSLFGDKNKTRFKTHLDPQLNRNQSNEIRLPMCNNGIYKNSLKYVNLMTNKPLFSTAGYTNCNGTFYTGIQSKHCPKTDTELWKVEIKPVTYAIWLAVIPLLVGNYWADLTFDMDAYLDAVEDAKSAIDIKSILLPFNKSFQKELNEIVANKQKMIATWDEEEEADRAHSEKMKAEREKELQREELKRALAEKAREDKALARKNTLIGSFNNAHKKGKSEGDVICSIDNRYGYLEKIAGKRIKVLFKGKLSNDYESYALFGSTYSTYNVVKENEMIWSDDSQWAKCNLKL